MLNPSGLARERDMSAPFSLPPFLGEPGAVSERHETIIKGGSATFVCLGQA